MIAPVPGIMDRDPRIGKTFFPYVPDRRNYPCEETVPPDRNEPRVVPTQRSAFILHPRDEGGTAAFKIPKSDTDRMRSTQP